MSKVIRIPKSVFLRLQKHAEPLVDTPANVIERLLDFYEEHNEEDEMFKSSEVNENRERDSEALDFDIFLAPASEENIKTSIKGSVHLSTAKKYLSSEQFESLSESLGENISFHCWAMNENSRAYYRTMKKNDYVLFKITGSGFFNFVGKVIYKFENEDFGQALWDVTPGKPWELIFVLDEIKPIKIDRVKMVEAFGYKSNYDVPGFRRVTTDHVEKMLAKYGSIDQMIDQLSE